MAPKQQGSFLFQVYFFTEIDAKYKTFLNNTLQVIESHRGINEGHH